MPKTARPAQPPSAGSARRIKPAAPTARTRQSAAPVGPRQAGRGQAAAADNWDQRLGFLMHDVSRLRRSVFDAYMKPLGVTRSQWWVLAYLSRHDGMIQSDLANVLDLGKAALGALIERLEATGLVERRPDPVDRRAKRVYLTGRGSQLITAMRTQSNAMSERMLAGLTAADRKQLVNLLTQVKVNLLALRDPADAGAADDAIAPES